MYPPPLPWEDPADPGGSFIRFVLTVTRVVTQPASAFGATRAPLSRAISFALVCEVIAQVPSITQLLSSLGLWATVYAIGRREVLAIGSLVGVSVVHGFVANAIGGKRAIAGAARAQLYAHLVTPLWVYAYQLSVVFPPLEHLVIASLSVSGLAFAFCFHIWALTQAGIRRCELSPPRALALALLALSVEVLIYLPMATPDVEPPWR